MVATPPSTTETAAASNCTVPGESFSWISTVAVAGAPSVAPTGALSTTVKSRSPRDTVSLTVVTVIVWLATPGENISVPLLAAYWPGAVAVPLAVAYFTLAAVRVPPVRCTVSVAVPPSTTR